MELAERRGTRQRARAAQHAAPAEIDEKFRHPSHSLCQRRMRGPDDVPLARFSPSRSEEKRAIRVPCHAADSARALGADAQTCVKKRLSLRRAALKRVKAGHRR